MTDEERRQFARAVAEESRALFEIASERLESRIQLVAEAVGQLDQRMRADGSEMRESMARGFDETQSMIKFSYVELERRMRTLEDTVAELRTRVDRLESGSH